MKNLTFRFLAILFLSFVLASCGSDTVLTPDVIEDEPVQVTPEQTPVKKWTEVKVLFIGNSFTEDACSYIPSLFSEAAPDMNFVFGIAYYPGSPLAQHYSNLTETDVTIDGAVYSPTLYVLNVSTNDQLPWTPTYNLSISDVLNYTDWDIITFQQGGAHSVKPYDTFYAPFVSEIKERVKSRSKESVKIGWLSIHGCYHINDAGLYEHWSKTTESSRRVMNEAGYDILFPFGTAVQNLRNCPLVENESDKFGWTVDNGHLQDGLGCLTAAYTNTLVLLNEINHSTNNIKFNFVPTPEKLTELHVPGVHLGEKGVVGITQFNCEAALESAKAAINNPYGITNIEETLGVEIIYED